MTIDKTIKDNNKLYIVYIEHINILKINLIV